MTDIKFDNVTKNYGDRAALEAVNAHLPDATWCVVVGPNGSGKTTFLSLASGLAAPTIGAVTVNDHVAGSAEARAEVSYFSDSPAFYSDLSVAEHIDYLTGVYGDHEIADRATELIELFDLSARIDDLPETFSRGMKQKTGLALALARPATVFMLDEPTRGLDTKGADTLISVLGDLHAHGASIITVTHEPEKFAGRAGLQLTAEEGEITQTPLAPVPPATN